MNNDPTTNNDHGNNFSDESLSRAVNELEKEPRPVPPSNVDPVPNSVANVNSQKSSNNKKKLIIILAIIILLIFAAGGTAFALWYTNPDKVTADAVKNLVSSKTMLSEGSYSTNDSESKSGLELTFKSQGDVPKLAGALDLNAKINYQNFSFNVGGAGMVSESGTVYFKLNNASELVNQALKSDYGKLYASSPKLQDALKKFIAKIDNKWIKLDKNDLNSYSNNYDQKRTCYKKSLDAFYADQSQQNQIVEAYKNNRFLTVKNTGKSDNINGQDSVSYEVAYNAQKSDDFGEAIKGTNVGSSLEKCDSQDKKSANKLNSKQSQKEKQQDQERQQKEADKVKTTLWISRWSHNLAKIETSSNDKSQTANFKATLKPNVALQLKDPTSSVSAKELQKDLNNIFILAQPEVSPSAPVPSQT